MKILREVKCSDRLPKPSVDVMITTKSFNRIAMTSDGDKWYSPNCQVYFKEEVLSWFEEVELDLKSEEIYPKDERLVTFDNKYSSYELALEAAELEIAELKVSKSAVSNIKKVRLRKLAKERYNEAWNFIVGKDSSDEYDVLHERIDFQVDLKDVKEALKIASGINDK